MCCLTASSVAMFSALVTTVKAGRRGPGGRVGAGRQGPGHLGGRGSTVEADHLTGPDHAGGELADALLLRRMPFRLVAQRQVVVDPLGDGAAPDPGEHLLAGQLVEVPADGGRGDVQRGRRLLHLELHPPSPAAPAGHSTGDSGSPAPPARAPVSAAVARTGRQLASYQRFMRSMSASTAAEQPGPPPPRSRRVRSPRTSSDRPSPARPTRACRTAAVKTLLSWVAMLILVIPARTAAARSRSGTPDEPCSTSGNADRFVQPGDQPEVEHRVAGRHGVRAADRDRKRVHPGRRDEAGRLAGIGAGERRVHAVLAADLPELRLDPDPPPVAGAGDRRPWRARCPRKTAGTRRT